MSMNQFIDWPHVESDINSWREWAKAPDMKLIVLDTETSGLPESGGQMIELAWMVVSLDGANWVTSSAYENYIQYSGPMDPRAQASHHIRADCLTAERGAILREQAVADLLNEIQPDSFLVAHNVDFDRKFLPELTNPWICTLRIAKRIWPEAPGHANQVLRYWLGIKPNLGMAPTIKQRAPHQALYDVATTVGILQKMLEKHSPEELYRIANTPQRLQNIGFGKHKGTDFSQIPRDYLQWLRGQSNLDEDLKFTLDSILQS
jgi:exodeoxyribonuclease X